MKPDAFSAMLERVRGLLQSRRFTDAMAATERRTGLAPADEEKRLLLRIDIATAWNDAAQLTFCMDEFIRHAQAHPMAAAKYVSSLRVRRCHAQAWQLLARFGARAELALESYHLGLEAAKAGARDVARACYEFALACRPGFIEAQINLGGLLLERRAFLQALPHFEAVTRANPDYANAWLGLGQCQLNTGQGAAALASFAHVSGSFAQSPLMTAWRATATAHAGNDATALTLYGEAMAADPQCFDAVFGYALLQERRRELGAAASAYARAYALRPQANWALGNLVYCLRCMADWERLPVFEAELNARLTRGDIGDYGTSLSSLDLPAAVLRRVAAHFVRAQSALIVNEVRRRDFTPRAGGRLRIGYASADFRDHATARLLVEALECHDRRQFEIFGYALTAPDDTPIGRRIVAACEHFADVAEQSVTEIAARMLDDGIDIMVDLNGLVKGTRFGLLALRPAPVVVNFLGYPGTLGDYADYILGDAIVTPPGSEHEFSEAVVRLPGCYQPNDRQREIGAPTTRAEHGLPETAIVACSFNQSWKFTPAIWAIWMRLLRKHSNLVLWLLDENPWFTEHLRGSAAAAGVQPGRVIFAPRLPYPEHMARLALADVALDTVPCNSHTTGSDALWMGVPLVTLVADNFAGRVGASLLHAVGMPELAATSEAGYETRLDELICAPARLAGLKARLLQSRSHAVLFDSAASARWLERAYTAMHERFAAGQAPGLIDLVNVPDLA